jgi:predicted amidohydrolase YtcJ
MNTINAAYASFEEDIKGSISPGKLADIVVLSDDPLKSPPERIKDIRVGMTIIGGKVAWET